MRAGLMILALVSLAGTATSDDVIGGGDAPAFTLQPVSDTALKSVPDSAISEGLWSQSAEDAPTIQLVSNTESAPSEVEGTLAESDTEASTVEAQSVTDEAAEPIHEPYFSLDTNSTEQSSTLASTDDGTNDLFVRLAVWTVIVLCLCVLTMLALRRWQRRQGILPAGAGRSRVLETLAIGPGRAVSLVQLGDVRAIVGTDGSGIKNIVLAPPAFDETLSEFNEETHNPVAHDAA